MSDAAHFSAAMQELTPFEKKEKVRQFQSFVNDHLKVELKKIISERDGIYEDIIEYTKLKNTCETMKEQKMKEVKTMVNLGSEFYVHAKM